MINKETFLNGYAKSTRLYGLLFVSILKSYKIYIYGILMPFLALIGIYWFSSSMGINYVRTPIIGSYINFVGFGFMFLVASLIFEWRDSIFIRRIKSSGLNKYVFLLCLWFVLLTFAAMIFFIQLGFMSFIDIFNNTHSIKDWFKSMNTFRQWNGILVSYLLNVFVCVAIASLIMGIFKSIQLTQTVLVLIIIFFVIFSDLFFDPVKFDKVSSIKIISYFVPTKYTVWMTYMYVAKIWESPYNMELIIPSVDLKYAFNGFTSVWLGTLGWICLYSTLASWTFNISVKK